MSNFDKAMEIKKAIAILARIQEPEAWEPQITKEAWQALEMAKEALVKESQGLAKDLPDTKVGNCSEIPNSSDTISRQAAIDVVKHAWAKGLEPTQYLEELPSAQPESHWIPCSERLPEDTAIVTVETKTFKQKYVCEAVWIPRWSKKAEYDNWEDCSEYNEDEDEYYVLEGWYERVYNWDEYSYVSIEDNVIAWMPRPEPYDAERRTDEAD